MYSGYDLLNVLREQEISGRFKNFLRVSSIHLAIAPLHDYDYFYSELTVNLIKVRKQKKKNTRFARLTSCRFACVDGRYVFLT